jgi:hypothetical protein
MGLICLLLLLNVVAKSQGKKSEAEPLNIGSQALPGNQLIPINLEGKINGTGINRS